MTTPDDTSADPRDLDGVDPADIDAAPENEVSFEKLQAAGRRMSPERVRTLVESLLFVADRPLTTEQLHEATGVPPEKLTAALEKLQGTRRDGLSGIVLAEVAGGWQLRTDPGSADYIKRFLKVKPQRLTRAAVETLAIIAYRQPTTRPEVEDIRGVDSGAVLKALLERGLIKILGKKEEVGRPILYGTTRKFLEFFSLRDLSSLPTLREFHELSEEHQEIVEQETPRPGPEGTVEQLADPAFQQRMSDAAQKSEEALVELEAAISTAEATASAADAILNPPAAAAPDEALPSTANPA